MLDCIIIPIYKKLLGNYIVTANHIVKGAILQDKVI